MDLDWGKRAERHLWPWYREAVAMAQSIGCIIEHCDTVSKGFLMHAQDCNVRYFFEILLEFKDRYALDVGSIARQPEWACQYPSRCLTSVCRTLHPDLYEDDMWNP